MSGKASVALEPGAVRRRLAEASTVRMSGRVTDVVGLVIESTGPAYPVGGLCRIEGHNGSTVPAEIVGFKKNRVLLMPLGEVSGIGPGSRIIAVKEKPDVAVGWELRGRVLDGLGRPLDGRGPYRAQAYYPLYGARLNPLERRPIREPLDLGVRAINSLLTCGRGQRLGIFAGSGVGKSSLLGMIARYTRAEVNVIALIGERGREVREFVERDLGEEGLSRSVVVAATSDQPPLVRLHGAFLATAIAEYFRDQGKDVILMMDSLTRFAMAQREVGLSVGEPPSSRGYTPSVFAVLPRLLERAGLAAWGSITGVYTVLVEGDDLNEPVADTTRALLDGHVVLSREMASHGRYPAIDVLRSVSRVMIDVVAPEQIEMAKRVRGWLATYEDTEDLINIGAYVSGKNPRIDEAVEKIDAIYEFIGQRLGEPSTLEEGLAKLRQLVGEGENGQRAVSAG